MSRGPRFLVSLIVTILAFIAYVHYAHVPPESYVPPPMLYKNCTARAVGMVTGTEARDLSMHLLEGSDTFYYVDYQFQARPMTYAEMSAAANQKGVARGSTTSADSSGNALDTFDRDTTVPQRTNVAAQALAGQPKDVFTGAVRVDQGIRDAAKKGQQLTVLYDPVRPQINGVEGTMGTWSRTTGYFNGYLWWYVGILAVAFVLQELIRMFTKTSDLRV